MPGCYIGPLRREALGSGPGGGGPSRRVNGCVSSFFSSQHGWSLGLAMRAGTWALRWLGD